MHTAIRKYRTSDAAELSRRVEDGFVPIVSQVPGFVGYYVVDAGDGSIASISVFDDQSGAEESIHRAADWVRENLAELVEGPPEVLAGEVTVKADR